jgi:DNA repair protein RadD
MDEYTSDPGENQPVRTPTLRPYQQGSVEEIRASFRSGCRSVLLASPTGSGKTVLFAHIVEGAMRRGNRCLVLAHRAEIVDQIDEALMRLGVPHGLIVAGSSVTPENVQVASVATLVRRLDRYDPFDLIVVDESHHAIAGTWREILDAYPDAKVLGVTATPLRLDGNGFKDIFSVMVLGPTTLELIKAGYLSSFVCYGPLERPDLSNVTTRAGDYAVGELSDAMARPIVIGSVIDAYERFARGKRGVVFGVDIRHSKALAQRFVERGYRAVHLDGDTPKDERRRIIKALASGEIDIITNCGLISEGFDLPAIEVAVLARPTQSLALYLQQVGRVLRPAPGKDKAIILDCVGNVYQHGMPDAPRGWSLEDQPKQKQDGGGEARPRTCKECFTIKPPMTMTCIGCGADLRTAQERREVEAELARIKSLQQAEALRRMRYREVLNWAGPNEGRLRQVAQARGYSRGWVWHRLNEIREGAI